MTKKDREIMNLKIRVKELETILCPLGNHDWEKIGYEVTSVCPTDCSETHRDILKCKRCGKIE